MIRTSPTAAAVVSSVCLLLGAHLAAAEPRDEHLRERERVAAHEHFDARFHHDRAYPARGFYLQTLPHQHFAVVRGGVHYYFSGGVWYAPRGPGFVVIAPPVGVFIPVLPAFYTTVWVAGAPYYYANDAYYAYRGPDQGYEVIDPPADAAVSTAPPGAGAPGDAPPGSPPQDAAPPGVAPPDAAAPGSSGEDFFIYPKTGQTPDQQAKDRYECHRWASGQTGFDPTLGGGGVPPDQIASKRVDYRRALGACLEGRGYTVR